MGGKFAPEQRAAADLGDVDVDPWGAPEEADQPLATQTPAGATLPEEYISTDDVVQLMVDAGHAPDDIGDVLASRLDQGLGPAAVTASNGAKVAAFDRDDVPLISGQLDRKWGTDTVREGGRSPWGAVQQAERLAPGIHQVSTAGHGGIKLSPQRNRKVDPSLRSADGWYEEDCDWAIPAITFPDEPAFRRITERMADPGNQYRDRSAIADGITHAERLIREYYPDEYEKLTGRPILPGQSSTRDQRMFDADHKDDHIGVSASRADSSAHSVPQDGRQYVIVHTRIGGRGAPAGGINGVFLVPQDEYSQRERWGFVIDPARHIDITNEMDPATR